MKGEFHRSHPGEVLRQYREMRGKSVADVASHLGLSPKMVTYVTEKQGTGLDSISRCRNLSTFLEIPPVLLGLDSLHVHESEVPWWIREGYPPFEADDTCHAYPQPGAVIKYYRLQRLKEASSEQKNEWIQTGFAQALGLQELTLPSAKAEGVLPSPRRHADIHC